MVGFFRRKHRHHLNAVGFRYTDDPDKIMVFFKCAQCGYEHIKYLEIMPDQPVVAIEEKNALAIDHVLLDSKK